jgi:hypothetical protein
MEETNNTFHDDVISWEAPEYLQHEKGWKWYLGAAIVIALLVIYGMFTNNLTLAIALVLASAVYLMVHAQTPKHVQVIVSKTGIKVGQREYPYQNIKYFWIIYEPHKIKTLNLETNSKYLPDISIQLGEQNPAELRTFLLMHIREREGKEESFVDTILRTLKL